MRTVRCPEVPAPDKPSIGHGRDNRVEVPGIAVWSEIYSRASLVPAHSRRRDHERAIAVAQRRLQFRGSIARSNYRRYSLLVQIAQCCRKHRCSIRIKARIHACSCRVSAGRCNQIARRQLTLRLISAPARRKRAYEPGGHDSEQSPFTSSFISIRWKSFLSSL